ncbi:MAG: type II secretion system protein [Candidatus Taylorbacteria bacterium]|nr:type II secretion system protein [Candidatus Taylorbacteria bacterium]
MKKSNTEKGFSALEVVVGAAIILTATLAILGAYGAFLSAALRGTRAMQATLLIEEAIEAVKFMRDSGWSGNIAGRVSNTPYYLTFDGSAWSISTLNQYIDGVFERQIRFSDVYRDSEDNIVPSGTLDAGTKKMAVTVSWSVGQATTSRSASVYVADLFAN